MEMKWGFSFRYDFGKHKKETCANSSEMNAMFNIPYTGAAVYSEMNAMFNIPYTEAAG